MHGRSCLGNRKWNDKASLQKADPSNKMEEYVSSGRLRRCLVAQHYPQCCYEITVGFHGNRDGPTTARGPYCTVHWLCHND
ncbi:hypothetical protein HZ326_20197 [Fusarium oxysporum f. sp. albedinis]|nr:hypothetical protein HZ326_20197 [Fusarium oxysporum f. sp. albedinis]